MTKAEIAERLLLRQSRALFTLARLLNGDRESALAQFDGLSYLLEALACHTLLLADADAENKQGSEANNGGHY